MYSIQHYIDVFCLTAYDLVSISLSSEGRRMYEEACKKGKVRVIRVLCDVIGEEDAGKSCLEDSMMDKPFIKNRPSTNGVKLRVMTHAIGDKADWRELKDEKERQKQISRLFAKEYVQRSQESESKTPNHQINTEVATAEEEVANDDFATSSTLASRYVDIASEVHVAEHDIDAAESDKYVDFQSAKEVDEDVQEAISMMEKDKEEIRKCEDMVIVTMMDRGGQDQFLSTHAALMADNAFQSTVCLLVFDGSKPLDEKVSESKFRLLDGTYISKPRDIATSRADLIRYYFTALYAAFPAGRTRNKYFGKGRGKGRVNGPPATFLVPTRKDKTQGKGDFVERQERIVREIIDEVGFGDRIVSFGEDPSKYEILFHVDNKKSGTGDPDPTIVLIKKMIIEMAQEYWSDEDSIPLPWAMLDKGLGRLQMAGHRILDIRDVYKLAARVCDISSKEECTRALRYLCSLGSIGFYHNVAILKDNVLPNLQWVADVLAIFVTVLDIKNVPPRLSRSLRRLHDKGIMSWNLAQFLLQKAEVDEANYKVILMLLHLFDVISGTYFSSSKVTAEVAIQFDQDFYVPCMVTKDVIQTRFHYFLALCSPKWPPPLFFVSKEFSSFLKPLFYRLVTRMVSRYAHYAPNLSRKQVILHLQKNVDLELVYTEKAVIATISPPRRTQLPDKSILGPLCNEVRVTLVEQLTEAKKRGMDGFQFEVFIHDAVDGNLEDYDPESLASLANYPANEILVKRNEDTIEAPEHLDMWYYSSSDEGKAALIVNQRI